jgi:TatD DNase family protein
MLIDTHCHLNMMVRSYDAKTHVALTDEEKEQCLKIIGEANSSNVSTIINVGTNLIESKTSIEVANLSSHIFATVGLHPNDAKKDSWKAVLAEFQTLIKENPVKVVGIGECGIDKHYPRYDLDIQKDVFKAQIELALEHNLGLVVHSRDAADETLEVLEQYKNETNLRGSMHCYSYTPDYARDILKMNFVLGLGGTITYKKNSHLREVAKETPLSRIVLETDAPFLAPQDHRGKPNKPAYIKNIAQFLAKVRNESFETIAKETTKNALTLFNIKQSA